MKVYILIEVERCEECGKDSSVIKVFENFEDALNEREGRIQKEVAKENSTVDKWEGEKGVYGEEKKVKYWTAEVGTHLFIVEEWEVE